MDIRKLPRSQSKDSSETDWDTANRLLEEKQRLFSLY